MWRAVQGISADTSKRPVCLRHSPQRQATGRGRPASVVIRTAPQRHESLGIAWFSHCVGACPSTRGKRPDQGFRLGGRFLLDASIIRSVCPARKKIARDHRPAHYRGIAEPMHSGAIGDCIGPFCRCVARAMLTLTIARSCNQRPPGFSCFFDSQAGGKRIDQAVAFTSARLLCNSVLSWGDARWACGSTGAAQETAHRIGTLKNARTLCPAV